SWARRRSSSPLRLPLVLSSSIARQSMVCLARGRLGAGRWPASSSARPRCRSAEVPSERMKVPKSISGSRSRSPAMGSVVFVGLGLAGVGARVVQLDDLGDAGAIGQGVEVGLALLGREQALLEVALYDSL